MTKWNGVTAILVGLAACSEQPTPRIFPEAAEISVLKVHFNDTRGRGVADINDAARIADFVGTLRGIKGKWNYTRWDTYPTPQERVVLVARDGAARCFVDLGPNWVGSDCGHRERDWPPSTSTSPDVAAHLRDAVGGKWALR